MSFLSDMITFEDALFYMHLCANNTLYSPEGADSPIQIMGALESAGLPFDKRIIVDVNDNVFPACASPNPFIPESQQIALRMPHCDADKELTFFKQLISSYQATSDEITYLYKTRHNDKPIRPCHFIQNVKIRTTTPTASPINYKDVLFQQIPVKTISEPLVQKQITHRTQGGMGLLRDQSQCPAKAFFTRYLNGRALPTIEPGFQPTDKGILLESSLAYFWDKHHSQDNLLNMTEQQLADELQYAIERALGEYRHRPDLNAAQFDLEYRYLSEVLTKWMSVEKTRERFVVEKIKDKDIVNIGPLTLNIERDRIDQLTEVGRCQGRLVLDVKRGIQLLTNIKPESMSAPQLPAYCIDIDQIQGAAFIQLHHKEQKMVGVGNEDSLTSPSAFLKVDNASFEDVVSGWNDTLIGIALDYVNNRLETRPSMDNCKYCDMKLACRAHELKVA